MVPEAVSGLMMPLRASVTRSTVRPLERREPAYGERLREGVDIKAGSKSHVEEGPALASRAGAHSPSSWGEEGSG